MSTMSRVEGLVLKPLAMSSLLFTVVSLFRHDWLAAVAFGLVWIRMTFLGMSLHREKGFRALVRGTLGPDWLAKDSELTRDVSYLLSRYSLSVAFICAVSWGLLSYHYGKSWWTTGWTAVLVFLVFWSGTTLVGFGFTRKTPEPTDPDSSNIGLGQDNFAPRETIPKDYPRAKVEFTREEAEQITRTREAWSRMLNESAPDGTKAYVPEKMMDAITASALTSYAEGLTLELMGAREDQRAVLMEKATEAQMKAYTVHRLPVYAYQVAEIFELGGDTTLAKECFQLFLDAQREFQADEIDAVFLRETGLDVAEAVAKAEAKLAPAKKGMTLADLRRALGERMEEEENQERTLSDLREVLKQERDEPTEPEESIFD
jgi:hypothetical protein